MKIKLVTLCLTLTLSLLTLSALALPAVAQELATTTLSVNDFSLTYDAALAGQVRVIAFPGDPVDQMQPGGPMPRSTTIELYPDMFAGEQMPTGVIHVFKTADFVGYPLYEAELAALNALAGLDQSAIAALASSGTGDAGVLPYLPTANAVQILRAQPRLIDTGEFSGIAYLTTYSQGIVPIHNAMLRYTLQLVSADGQTYVGATFNVSSPLLPDEVPAGYNATGTQYEADLAAALELLTGSAPAEFSPSLEALQMFAATFAVDDAAVDAEAEARGAQEEAADPSLGGLAGSWTLTGWGSPDALTPVLEGTTITAVFGAEGVGGSGGCNTYGGPFVYDNGALMVGPLASTRRACEQPIMDQEFAFEAAFMAAQTYALDGDTLTITYDGGVLVFARGE
jgi:heat shock protein HslJ